MTSPHHGTVPCLCIIRMQERADMTSRESVLPLYHHLRERNTMRTEGRAERHLPHEDEYCRRVGPVSASHAD